MIDQCVHVQICTKNRLENYVKPFYMHLLSREQDEPYGTISGHIEPHWVGLDHTSEGGPIVEALPVVSPLFAKERYKHT